MNGPSFFVQILVRVDASKWKHQSLRVAFILNVVPNNILSTSAELL